MSRTQFINFGNDQTYHCFCWLRDSRAVDIDALVREAVTQIQGETWFDIGMDVSTVSRDKLAELIEDQVNQQLDGLPGGLGADLGIGDIGTSAAHLFGPILRRALDDIRYDVIAVALLIAAGKWNPDRELPQAE